ncbi:MAG: DNA-binding protein [bacterium]|nr:DNA-binding protein [bacterium]
MTSIDEKKQIALMMDVYGGLLTDRQREFLDLHFNEDLSYGEIADNSNISRQAVHDAIQHGKKSLLRFEEELGLAAKLEKNHDGVNSSGSEESVDLSALRDEIQALSGLIHDDIIYDVVPIQRSIRRLKDLAGMES